MTDRMVFLKNWEVKAQFQNRQREQGGYVVNSECRHRRACAMCTEGQRITPQKLTNAEYDFARAKNTKRLDRSIARQNYIICPYEECPFKELMEFKSYRDYEKHIDMEVPDIYHLMGSEEERRRSICLDD